MKRYLVPLLVCLLAPAALHAQTVANPIAVEFTASPDHSVLAPVTGTPLVTGYRMKVFAPSACTTTACTGNPTFTLTLNKPTPNAQNVIRVNDIFGGLVMNTLYRGVVEAFGPGGATAAAPTGPFGNETIPAPRAPANSAVFSAS